MVVFYHLLQKAMHPSAFSFTINIPLILPSGRSQCEAHGIMVATWVRNCQIQSFGPPPRGNRRLISPGLLIDIALGFAYSLVRRYNRIIELYEASATQNESDRAMHE